MARYIFRGCPRCGGDLYLNYQHSSMDDWRCLQCGHHPRRAINARAKPLRSKAGDPGLNNRIRQSLL